MIEEPRLAQNAGPLGLVNAHLVGVQLNVVADASAKGARRVIDDFQFHG